MRVALAGAVLFLGLSNSLGGVLAAAMLCAVIALHRYAQSAGVWVVVIPPLAVLLGSLAAAAGLLDGVLAALGKDPTLSSRTEIWSQSMQLVLERPLLGQSIASFWQQQIVETTGMWFPNAHNGYLQLAIELGLVGLSLFLFQLSTTVVRSLGWTPLRDRAALWPYCVATFVLVYNLWEVATVQESSILWVLYVSASLAVRAPAAQALAAAGGSGFPSLRPTGPSRVAGSRDVRELARAVALFCVLATLPGTLELLLLSLAALVSRWRPPRPQEGAPCGRIAVVVPAHNEEGTVGACVQALQAAIEADGQSSLVVVADCCSDATAEVCEGLRARVLVREDDQERGKGFALRDAWQRLRSEGVDALAVVDADTIVEPNFVCEIRRHLRGADAVQVRNLVGNADASVRTRLLALALLAMNVVRPLGRERLGLSAGLFGNGFAVRRDALEQVPFRGGSITEDLDHHLRLVLAGRRARFVDSTTVWSEMVTRGGEAASQRIRWEGGRLNLVWSWAPRLRARDREGTPVAGRAAAGPAHASADLSRVASRAPRGAPLRAARVWAAFGFAVLALHVALAARLGGRLSDLTVLAAAPAYLLWKLPLLGRIAASARPGAPWQRTSRSHDAAPRNPPS